MVSVGPGMHVLDMEATMTRRIGLTALGAAVDALRVAAARSLHRSEINPSVTQDPDWDTRETEQLARRACYDCHSNEVDVPWYGTIAPVAWVVRHHVDEGRGALEPLRAGSVPRRKPTRRARSCSKGEMPPRYYLLLHSEARLTDAERRTLAAGLDATLGGEDHERGVRSSAHTASVAPTTTRRNEHGEDDDSDD